MQHCTSKNPSDTSGVSLLGLFGERRTSNTPKKCHSPAVVRGVTRDCDSPVTRRTTPNDKYVRGVTRRTTVRDMSRARDAGVLHIYCEFCMVHSTTLSSCHGVAARDFSHVVLPFCYWSVTGLGEIAAVVV